MDERYTMVPDWVDREREHLSTAIHMMRASQKPIPLQGGLSGPMKQAAEAAARHELDGAVSYMEGLLKGERNHKARVR